MISAMAMTSIMVSSCNKCGTYELKDGESCIEWSEQFAGTWHPDASTYMCSDGVPFGGNLTLDAEGPNTLSIDGQLFLTIASEQVAEGGPYTLGDNNSTWTVRFRAEYYPTEIIKDYDSFGQLISSTTVSEHIMYKIWRNEGQSDASTCSARMVR